MNTLKTTLLLGLLAGFLVALGGVVGGREGMAAMLVVSLIINLGTWFFADTLVIRTTGAVPVPRQDLPWLHDDLEAIARAAGIPTPRLYWTPDPSPNAFATGRSPSKGVVAVTAGLLETLDRREIRGVLAHEVGHITNRDTLISAVAASIAGVVTWLSYMVLYQRDQDVNPLVRIAVMLLAPLAAGFLRMAISRTREYAADERAARLTGDPHGLADALEGLGRGVRRVPMHEGAENVHMIVNGFSGTLGSMMSTHPPLEERIRRLRAMA